jgi:RNA-dependent RNA polymerase
VLLSCLGVADEVFVKFQEEYMNHMIQMLTNEETALEYLSLSGASNLYPLQLLKGVISFTNEPHFRSLLHAIYKQRVVNLKRKAHIPIAKSRILMGAVDDVYRVLEYGEVFIHVSGKSLPGSNIIIMIALSY